MEEASRLKKEHDNIMKIEIEAARLDERKNLTNLIENAETANRLTKELQVIKKITKGKSKIFTRRSSNKRRPTKFLHRPVREPGKRI